MKIMAIDYGDVRTGIAVCDKLEMLASALCVIKETDEEVLCDIIAKKVKDEQAQMLVVGLPKNMDGSCGERAQKCIELANILRVKCQIPVEMWDERLTTVISYRSLNSANVFGKKSKKIVDAVAAATILQGFIDHRKLTGKS